MNVVWEKTLTEKIMDSIPKLFFANFHYVHCIAYGSTFTCMPIGTNKASWFTANYAYDRVYGLLFMVIIFPSGMTVYFSCSIAIILELACS